MRQMISYKMGNFYKNQMLFYKENCMNIITTFGVRGKGKIEPKNGPQRNGFFGGLLKK